MTDTDDGVNVAAGVEVRFQLHPNRICGRHKVIEDAVGDLFMGDRLIAVAVDVELDRLELHYPRAWLVDQAQHREIGVAGEGAFAGELRQLDRHLIRPPGPGIIEGDQFSFSDGSFAIEGGLSQRGQLGQF